jgi:hypothetical protein
MQKLCRFCSEDSSQSAFFLDPSFEEKQFPRAVVRKPPNWFLMPSINRNDIVNALQKILSISSHEVLVVTIFSDVPGHKN